jgi:general secretion pathway protein A
MYCEYWGLKKPPFDNVPDPTMYVESHASVENAVTKTLCTIKEGNESIAAIVGDVGLGKTLSLRLILDNLSQDRYKVAFITNPDMSFLELMREIVGQLTGQPCEIHKRIDLLEAFNKIIFQTADEREKVLLFIDEANALPLGNLESLRLLTNLQEDTRNLFTIVLAGQTDLARRLGHSRRANPFQEVGTYCRIEKIESPELAKDYVETRLRLAGTSRKIFTDEAIDILWEYSDHGVPRLINKICKLCLRAGATTGAEIIDGATSKQVAERFHRLTGSALQKRRPRIRLWDNTVEKRTETETSECEHSESLNLGGESLDVAGALPDDQHLGGKAADEGNEAVPESVSEADRDEARESVPAEARSKLYEEAVIGRCKITIGIPLPLLDSVTSSTRENRAKLAGNLAAQTLEKYPQLTREAADAVALWSEIRNLILGVFEREIARSEAEVPATA